VIVTLKTTANDQFEALIGPLLHDSSLILTLQNGLGNEQRLAEAFGAEHVLGGLAFVCINRLADGAIRHFDHGQIQIGELSGGPRPRTVQIAGLFRASNVPCNLLDDLRHGRWEKLVWNVPFNGLGALLDKTTDQLIAAASGTALVNNLMLEIMRTAAALGVHLPDNLPQEKIEQTRSMGAYRTSMQIDRQQGRLLEVESILAKPLAAARTAGVSTPYLQMLYDLLASL
jgi:2-dehydropantoate 2-reductase